MALATPAAPAAAEPPAIDFHNRIAIKVGLISAGLAALLGVVQLPLAIFWTLVRLIAAGFLAVWLYRRSTGSTLSGREGARLGWITGVFSFLLATILLTISVADIASRQSLSSFYQEQLRSQSYAGMNVEEAARLLENPVALGAILVVSLVFLFLFFALLPMVGGIMGAKVLEKD